MSLVLYCLWNIALICGDGRGQTAKCLQMSDGLANTAALIAEHQMRFFRNSTFQLFVKFSTVIWDFFFPFCLPRCIYLIVVSKQHLNFIIICEAEDNNMYSTHFSLFYLSVASSPSYVSYFILLVFTDWKVWHKCTIMMLTQLCVIIYQSIIWYIYVIINHFISIL